VFQVTRPIDELADRKTAGVLRFLPSQFLVDASPMSKIVSFNRFFRRFFFMQGIYTLNDTDLQSL
jgi:hypothetical protein